MCAFLCAHCFMFHIGMLHTLDSELVLSASAPVLPNKVFQPTEAGIDRVVRLCRKR